MVVAVVNKETTATIKDMRRHLPQKTANRNHGEGHAPS